MSGGRGDWCGELVMYVLPQASAGVQSQAGSDGNGVGRGRLTHAARCCEKACQETSWLRSAAVRVITARYTACAVLPMLCCAVLCARRAPLDDTWLALFEEISLQKMRGMSPEQLADMALLFARFKKVRVACLGTRVTDPG